MATTSAVGGGQVNVDADPAVDTELDEAVDVVEPDESVASDGEPEQPRRGPWLVAAAVTVGVATALLAAGVLLLLEILDAQSAREREQQVLQAARKTVVNLTTMSRATAAEDVDRLLASTTGSFREQLTNASGSFETVLREAKVVSSGEVTEAAIVRSDDQRATVLVAASATVKNSEAPKGEPRSYRMQVTLEFVDESWLVSDVEFVP